MKALFITIGLLFIANECAARKVIIEEFMPEVMLEESVKDNSINKNQAKYNFVFRNLYLRERSSRSIKYSIDGKSGVLKMGEKQDIEIITTPGNHIFQFYYDDSHNEIYTDSLNIPAGFKNTYSVYMYESSFQIMEEKPVIYVYPEEETSVEISIDIKGEKQFLYPQYEDSWKFVASPNGDLKFGDETYNYLFWESSQSITLPSRSELKGFIVKGTEVITFLEEKLSEAGLNSKEQADFITYWGPRLVVNEFNFVRFEFNEECARYAALTCTPAPANVYRINMQWHAVAAPFDIESQEIKSANREGFYLIEWGGQEIKRGKIRDASIKLVK